MLVLSQRQAPPEYEESGKIVFCEQSAVEWKIDKLRRFEVTKKASKAPIGTGGKCQDLTNISLGEIPSSTTSTCCSLLHCFSGMTMV